MELLIINHGKASRNGARSGMVGLGVCCGFSDYNVCIVRFFFFFLSNFAHCRPCHQVSSVYSHSQGMLDETIEKGFALACPGANRIAVTKSLGKSFVGRNKSEKHGRGRRKQDNYRTVNGV